MAAYSRRFARKHQPLSAEFMTLLVVVAAALGTAWWAAHTLGMNLSGIETIAAVLGVSETAEVPRQVGYSADANSEVAPYCQAGQAPAFTNGLQALSQQIGEVMGAPVECEHAASPNGDTVQQTSTGLAAYNKQTNTDSFTDGWHHWALTPNGLVAWEGTDATPPQ